MHHVITVMIDIKTRNENLLQLVGRSSTLKESEMDFCPFFSIAHEFATFAWSLRLNQSTVELGSNARNLQIILGGRYYPVEQL